MCTFFQTNSSDTDMKIEALINWTHIAYLYLIGYGIHSVLIKHQNVQITLYLANICLYDLTYVVCLCVLCKPRDFTDTLATDIYIYV